MSNVNLQQEVEVGERAEDFADGQRTDMTVLPKL